MVLWAIPRLLRHNWGGDRGDRRVAGHAGYVRAGGVAIAIRPLLITSISSSSVEKRWEGQLWAGQAGRSILLLYLKLEPEEIGMLLRVSL